MIRKSGTSMQTHMRGCPKLLRPSPILAHNSVSLRIWWDDTIEDEEFSEGRILKREHLRRERNKRAVKQKKKKVLQETGRLACEICGFDFAEKYGERGEGFIECHHNVPLSELGENTSIRLSDLSLVCSNCHRMIHWKRPLLTINGLASLIK